MGSVNTPSVSELAVTSIRIERDMLDRFKQVAAANQRTVSQELRWQIHQAVDAYEAERKEAA